MNLVSAKQDFLDPRNCHEHWASSAGLFPTLMTDFRGIGSGLFLGAKNREASCFTEGNSGGRSSMTGLELGTFSIDSLATSFLGTRSGTSALWRTWSIAFLLYKFTTGIGKPFLVYLQCWFNCGRLWLCRSLCLVHKSLDPLRHAAVGYRVQIVSVLGQVVIDNVHSIRGNRDPFAQIAHGPGRHSWTGQVSCGKFS